MVRTYYTNYSIKDTIGLLKRKNIYDTLIYKLEITEQGMFIIFTGANTHWCGSIHTKYAITFSSVREGTMVSLDFISELLWHSFPMIPDKWIDEFMEKKLAAKRSRLDDRTSCDVDREEKAKYLENINKFIIVFTIIVTVVVGLIAVFFLSVFWPRMPWVAKEYINNADEYMVKTYDFEVERVGWFVNIVGGSPCYRVYYRKMDGSDTIITVYGSKNVDMYRYNYQCKLFYEKYESYIVETGKKIMGEGADVEYEFLNPGEEEPPEAKVKIDVYLHGEIDEENTKNNLVKLYNEICKADFNLGEIVLHTDKRVFFIDNLRSNATLADVKFFDKHNQ